MATVQHIGFNCIDRAAQEAFYTKHFGFQRARVFEADTPNQFVMLRAGSVCIELFPTPDAVQTPSAGEQAVGFKHLALEVGDIEQKVAELEADGVQTDGIIDCSDEVPGLRVCFFRDPEGNIIEIMEGWQDDPSLEN